MADTDHVETQRAAKDAVAAAQASVQAGRSRQVPLEVLDAYFDALKAEADSISDTHSAG